MGREKQILDAAEQLFFERGFDGVGVDAIGELAGMSGSAIYRHFDGKNEILGVLFDQAIDALLLSIQAPGPDPAADLEGLVEAHVRFSAQHPKLAAIWLREERSLADPYRKSYRRRQQRYIDRWRVCLETRYPGAPPERITTAMRAVHALMLSDATRPARSKQSEDAVPLLRDMALRALSTLDG
ncbi:TetR/AcrR family transcriptional regulator [Pseudonocardia spirodelae]|uniref:TetR/AcrR family transcriptional regulator n=1 Tax=Pseudonocardia spirodelae TaxID=3133431 RepID=A0ABU8T681_9PSEU